MNQLEALTLGIVALGALACILGIAIAEAMVILSIALIVLWAFIEWMVLP